MKVGIVTYQFAYNFGAVLQCLALQRTLERLGMTVSAVNYFPPDANGIPIWKQWGIRRGKFFEQIRNKRVRIMYAKPMRKAFDEFRSAHIRLSNPCVSNAEIESVTKEYDVLIAGSDQIWHFSRPSMYFLEWGSSYKGRRISYAPCCGRRDQDERKKDEVREWLSHFDHISVRNEFSRDLVHELTGKQVPVVADPTLLLDLSDVQQKVELPCSDYILTYTLGSEIQGGNKKAIKHLREKIGNLKVVAVVPSAHVPHVAPWADVLIMDAGPSEWLYLIAHASYIFTDSFHGALFSIQNNKPFFAYYSEASRSPRLIDLAERYEIQDAVGNSVESAVAKDWGLHLNYERIHSLISKHVTISIEYLKCALDI